MSEETNQEQAQEAVAEGQCAQEQVGENQTPKSAQPFCEANESCGESNQGQFFSEAQESCKEAAVEPSPLPCCDTEKEELKSVENKDLRLSLQFDDKNELFVMAFLQGDNILFQVRLAVADFEKLSCDMIRTIKNYNLYKADLYKQMLEDKKVQEGSAIPEAPQEPVSASEPQVEPINE